jgi:hypothetical protein
VYPAKFGLNLIDNIFNMTMLKIDAATSIQVHELGIVNVQGIKESLGQPFGSTDP